MPKKGWALLAVFASKIILEAVNARSIRLYFLIVSKISVFQILTRLIRKVFAMYQPHQIEYRVLNSS